MMGDSSLEYTCMHDQLCIQALEFVYLHTQAIRGHMRELYQNRVLSRLEANRCLSQLYINSVNHLITEFPVAHFKVDTLASRAEIKLICAFRCPDFD